MADSINGSKCRGKPLFSGVSLVDNIMVLLINVFAALATGGAVVAGQYLGQKQRKKANIILNWWLQKKKSGNITSDKRYKEALYAEYIPSNHIQIDIVEKMTEIIQNKQEKEIVEALQIVEPRITDVQLVGKRVM
mgnify:CR=1 FL=1